MVVVPGLPGLMGVSSAEGPWYIWLITAVAVGLSLMMLLLWLDCEEWVLRWRWVVRFTAIVRERRGMLGARAGSSCGVGVWGMGGRNDWLWGRVLLDARAISCWRFAAAVPVMS